jgi:hypothetical protein
VGSHDPGGPTRAGMPTGGRLANCGRAVLQDHGLSLGLAKEVVDRNLTPEMLEPTEALRDSAWEALTSEAEES